MKQNESYLPLGIRDKLKVGKESGSKSKFGHKDQVPRAPPCLKDFFLLCL